MVAERSKTSRLHHGTQPRGCDPPPTASARFGRFSHGADLALARKGTHMDQPRTQESKNPGHCKQVFNSLTMLKLHSQGGRREGLQALGIQPFHLLNFPLILQTKDFRTNSGMVADFSQLLRNGAWALGKAGSSQRDVNLGKKAAFPSEEV